MDVVRTVRYGPGHSFLGTPIFSLTGIVACKNKQHLFNGHYSLKKKKKKMLRGRFNGAFCWLVAIRCWTQLSSLAWSLMRNRWRVVWKGGWTFCSWLARGDLDDSKCMWLAFGETGSLLTTIITWLPAYLLWASFTSAFASDALCILGYSGSLALVGRAKEED